MDFIADLKSNIPDFAKDIRLNLDSVILRSSINQDDATACALAAAFASGSKKIVDSILTSGKLSKTQSDAALTAASLMAMNNIYYPFVEMATDPELKGQKPELRMNAYATYGGVDKRQFEMYALSASIVGKCHFCVQSHYALLRKEGLTSVQLRDIGRIAAVISAAARIVEIR